mmetsp:Transcript_10249/g.20572  ORF Transcript_10249/g.20572 Transcript_10249/m.20572 type:complete len:245 (+) Transcript_10249:359-1093(+)
MPVVAGPRGSPRTTVAHWAPASARTHRWGQAPPAPVRRAPCRTWRSGSTKPRPRRAHRCSAGNSKVQTAALCHPQSMSAREGALEAREPTPVRRLPGRLRAQGPSTRRRAGRAPGLWPRGSCARKQPPRWAGISSPSSRGSAKCRPCSAGRGGASPPAAPPRSSGCRRPRGPSRRSASTRSAAACKTTARACSARRPRAPARRRRRSPTAGSWSPRPPRCSSCSASGRRRAGPLEPCGSCSKRR